MVSSHPERTQIQDRLHRISHPIPVGVLLDIWLGIVKTRREKDTSLFIKHDEIIGDILQYKLLLHL